MSLAPFYNFVLASHIIFDLTIFTCRNKPKLAG